MVCLKEVEEWQKLKKENMKICQICHKQYKPTPCQKAGTCSELCTRIKYKYSYYDIDGKLKITNKGLNKLKI